METPYTGEAQGTAEMYTGHQEGRYDFYCDQKTVSRGPDGNAGSEPNLERAEAFEPARNAGKESKYMMSAVFSSNPIKSWMASMMQSEESMEAALRDRMARVQMGADRVHLKFAMPVQDHTNTHGVQSTAVSSHTGEQRYHKQREQMAALDPELHGVNPRNGTVAQALKAYEAPEHGPA